MTDMLPNDSESLFILLNETTKSPHCFKLQTSKAAASILCPLRKEAVTCA